MLKRDEIVVGTVIVLGLHGCGTKYEVLSVSNKDLSLKSLLFGIIVPYRMEDRDLSYCTIVSQPEKELTFEDLEVGKTYCVKCNEDLRYSVVYKDSTGAAMCNSSGKLIAVGFNEGCIKYWKEYVELKEPEPKEYDTIWHKGGCNNSNKIVAVLVPVGVRPKDIKNILKIERLTYKN